MVDILTTRLSRWRLQPGVDRRLACVFGGSGGWGATKNIGFATIALFFLWSALLLLHSVEVQAIGTPRAEIVKLLDDRYAETPAFMAVARDGGVLEALTTRDRAAWTVVLTMPNGLSRVLMFWEEVAPLVGRLL